MSQASAVSVRQAAIHRRAYERWQERGCPVGSSQEDWLAAECELTAAPQQVVRRRARARRLRVHSLAGTSPGLLAALASAG